MSNGMCPICNVVPAQLHDGKPTGYCKDCELRRQRERYAVKKNRGFKYNWGSKGKPNPNRTPPVDWREVLRKAEEPKA